MMDQHEALSRVLSGITAERIKSVMIELARIPSPLTELLEAEPALRRFIDAAVEPRLRPLGITDIHRDRMGNLLANWGRAETGRSLMLVTNAMNQPAATMPNPYGGEVRAGAPYGLPGEVVLGKGLSEQKAPLAAVLVALEAISSSAVELTGQLVFLCCVSGETGRHDAIRSIVESSGVRADMAVLNGTGNRISLGNRGRVDVTVTVHGSPCHSRGPMDGCNAATGAIEVIRRLSEGLRLPPGRPL
jgi:acetylornithine deacetylase/succinyl-diaminopimelate desuccinylase-like protein